MKNKVGRPKGRNFPATITIQLKSDLKKKIKELYGRKTNTYINFLIENDLKTTGGKAHKSDIGGRVYFAPEYVKNLIDNLSMEAIQHGGATI